MKKILFMTALVSIGMLFVVSASMATPINPIGGDGSNTSLQDVLNSVTSPYPGVSSVNVNTDQVAADAYWAIGAAGGSISTIVIELAGWKDATTFGIFSGDNVVQVFAGSANSGNQATVGIGIDGSVFLNFLDTNVDFAGNNFGYYIGTQNGTFYSDTSKNGDNFDHMVAFQGKGDTVRLPGWTAGQWKANEYVLGFEDTYGGGDWDYQDLVVMVESVNPNPVPEPTSLLLLGLGLVGLAGIRRKFKSSKS